MCLTGLVPWLSSLSTLAKLKQSFFLKAAMLQMKCGSGAAAMSIKPLRVSWTNSLQQLKLINNFWMKNIEQMYNCTNNERVDQNYNKLNKLLSIEQDVNYEITKLNKCSIKHYLIEHWTSTIEQGSDLEAPGVAYFCNENKSEVNCFSLSDILIKRQCGDHFEMVIWDDCFEVVNFGVIHFDEIQF